MQTTGPQPRERGEGCATIGLQTQTIRLRQAPMIAVCIAATLKGLCNRCQQIFLDLFIFLATFFYAAHFKHCIFIFSLQSELGHSMQSITFAKTEAFNVIGFIRGQKLLLLAR
jgi:hypothetical protein